MNDRNGRFDTIYTGKPNNVRHVVNTVNSAQFGIESVMPCMGISVRCVNFSLCSLLTRQKRDSNNNSTSYYNRESMASIVFVYIQSITKIFEYKSDVCQHHVHGQKRIGNLFVGGNIFSGVCRNCLLSCLLLREEGEECHWCEWITKENTRIKCVHLRANACESTRFSTRVCAKMVHAFWVCVGHLSLTCTVNEVFIILLVWARQQWRCKQNK